MNEKEIYKYLSRVLDPDVGLPITELGMVGKISVNDDNIEINIKLTSSLCPLSGEIEGEIQNVLSSNNIKMPLRVNKTVMNKEELEVFTAVLKKKTHAQTQEYSSHLVDKPVYAFVSGKGGVGKSSVTAMVASYIADKYNLNIGVIDADIYGHSLDRIFGLDTEQLKPIVIDGFIMPYLIKKHNIRFMSIANFLHDNIPIVLRGPMLHKILFRLIVQTYWKNIDILLIDYPPGTGDVPLSLGRMVSNIEAFLVTTPEPMAQSVAERMMMAANTFKLKMIALIENMSYRICTGCKKREYIFGSNDNNTALAKKYCAYKKKIELPFFSLNGVNAQSKLLTQDANLSKIVEFMNI